MLSRTEFYAQFKHQFNWYDADGYACFDVHPIEPETVQAIQQAATDVWQVLCQAGEIMRSLDDETLLYFGYPPETFDLIRTTTQPPFIARCDFAVTPNGIYLLECNAEVATFIVETFQVNGWVANYFDYQDPNEGAEAILSEELNRYLEVAATYINKPLADCRIVFCALSEADEDVGTVEYLRSLCSVPTHFCPIEQLAIDDGAVYDQLDQPVDIIYRVYPTEWMVEDKDPVSGTALWNCLEPLLFHRKVALINPLSAFILQNKALLAFITEKWYGNRTDPVAEIVHRYFLPTFMHATQLMPPYVAKPTYGREGKEVEIIHNEERTIYNAAEDYATLPKVYQQYVDLPTIHLDEEEWTLQYSCFLVNGKAIGVAARIGKRVISNLSHFLPIGIF